MLPQPGIVSLPFGIRRESLMRILFTTPADNTEIRRFSNLDAPSANSVVLHVWGPRQKPRPLVAAMSWLTKSIVDGLAAYGEMICPYLIDLPDAHADHQQSGSIAPWPLRREPQSDEASEPPPAPPPAREGITVRLARWLARLRPQPRPDHAAPGPERETLDDRTLRDIGMPPYHPDDLERYLERYLDHGGW